MSLFTAAVYPGRALGIFVLDATLHDVLTRVKADAQLFPKLDLIFDDESPVKKPVIVHLPSNGLRLRFDGAQQRLRLIEVLDFTLSKLQYKDRDIYKGGVAEDGPLILPAGPTYRHVYNRLFGPTFPGEYIEPIADDNMGTYVLSYPGVAFSFPVEDSSWSATEDSTSILSSPSSLPAKSMAIFHGDSWSNTRETLFIKAPVPSEATMNPSKAREAFPRKIDQIRIHGAGSLELEGRGGKSSFWVQLGETTAQTLVAELGPPDAIYRKHEHAMAIHENGALQRGMSNANGQATEHVSQDTRRPSLRSMDDDTDSQDEDSGVEGGADEECFYNYFHHGFDILVSTRARPSPQPPSKSSHKTDRRTPFDQRVSDGTQMIASKFIIHGNVPGSYAFHRHSRCQWEIAYLNKDTLTSESSFTQISERLQAVWGDRLNADSRKSQARGMALNRDWENSLSSSCELLGGWEGNPGVRPTSTAKGVSLGKTTLFGFPGLVFEVLQNDCVGGVTVF